MARRERKLVNTGQDNCRCPLCYTVHTETICEPSCRERIGALIAWPCPLCVLKLTYHGQRVWKLLSTLPLPRYRTRRPDDPDCSA